MGTFAISYRKHSSSAPSAAPELIVHFNHWQLAKGTKGLQFVDLGFTIRYADGISQIKLIFPFIVAVNEIIDLSYTLQDLKNLQSVFSRILQISHDGDGGMSVVSNPKDPTNWHHNFLLLTIEPAQLALSYKEKHSICLLTLTATQLAQIAAHSTKTVYLRLRLLGGSIHTLTAVTKPSFSKPFLTSFYEEQMIEVNFNKERNLPRSTRDDIDQQFHVASLNYFLIKDAKYCFKSSSSPFDNLRRLEHEIWSEYITLPRDKIRRHQEYHKVVGTAVEEFNRAEARVSKAQLLAYQWDFDGSNGKFNVFAWFQREFINLRWFIIGLVVVSLFFELAGNYLYDCLTPNPKPTTGQSPAPERPVEKR